VLIPNSNPPLFDLAAPGPAAHDRERAILNLLASSPVTTWLADAVPGWHAQVEAWKITDSDGRRITTAISEVRPDHDTNSKSEHAGPLVLAAQFHTGLAADPSGSDAREPAVVLTIAVMIWLAELTADRQPDEGRHTEEPLPAALSLPEAYNLLVALTRSVNTAHAALVQLTEVADVSREILIDLEMETRPGIEAVIDLSKFSRVSTGRRTQYRQAFETRADPLDGRPVLYTPALDEIALIALDEWLLQSGYREYEQALRDLSRPPEL
jgi:hypothetical protein